MFSGPRCLDGVVECQQVRLFSDAADDNLYLASRNLAHVGVCDAADADPVSLVGFDKVLVTRAALQQIEERLA